MPIYEYQCPDCGHRFEKLQKISDDPVSVCPECGEGGVRKLVSQSAFILKGSGWYKDHYGLKKSGGDSKGDSTGGSSSSTSTTSADSGTKSDSAKSASPASSGASTTTSSSSSSSSGS